MCNDVGTDVGNEQLNYVSKAGLIPHSVGIAVTSLSRGSLVVSLGR
jgi:hypothetical protein